MKCLLRVGALAVILATLVMGDCGNYGDCASCINHKAAGGGGCGWCASTNQCSFGDSSRSFSNTCSATAWNWNTCPGTAPAPTGATPWNYRGGDDHQSYFRDTKIGTIANATVRWGRDSVGDGLHIISGSNGVADGEAAFGGGMMFFVNGQPDSNVYLNAVDVKTGAVKINTTLMTSFFSSQKFIDSQVIYDATKQWVYVRVVGQAQGPLGNDEGSSTFFWAYDVSQPTMDYMRPIWSWESQAGRSSHMLHVPERDELHYVRKATGVNSNYRFFWEVLEAKRGTLIHNGSAFGLDAGQDTNPRTLSRLNNIILADLNGYLAAFYLDYQAVVWTQRFGPGDATGRTLTTLPALGGFLVYTNFLQVSVSYYSVSKSGPVRQWQVTAGAILNIPTDQKVFLAQTTTGDISSFFVENGTQVAGAANYSASGQEVTALQMTKDYVFGHVQGGDLVNVWNRATGARIHLPHLNAEANHYVSGGASGITGSKGNLFVYDGRVYVMGSANYRSSIFGVEFQTAGRLE